MVVGHIHVHSFKQFKWPAIISFSNFFTFKHSTFSSNRTIIFRKQIALPFGHDIASMKLYRKLVNPSLDHFYQVPFQ